MKDEEKDLCVLNITLVNNDNWQLTLEREDAEKKMLEFHNKIFKRGTIRFGRTRKQEFFQVVNIAHICSMSIKEESEVGE